MILVIVLELYWAISNTVILIRKWNAIWKKLISFVSDLSSPLHLLSSHFLHRFFTLFFFLPIDLNVFEFLLRDQLSKILRSYVSISLFQLSTCCVFCAIASHHIDNEIINLIIKSFLNLWLFIIDWSIYSILFLRYLIEFHQTIVLFVANGIIRW